MNIYFVLTDEPASQQAELEFWFKDIDLDPTNDPHGFFESVKLSYWDAGTNTLVSVGDVIDQASELTSGVFSNAETTPEFLIDPTDDPITWTIDLTLLTGLGVDVLASKRFRMQREGSPCGCFFCPGVMPDRQAAGYSPEYCTKAVQTFERV